MLGLWFHLLTLSVTSELHVTMVEKDQVQPRVGSFFYYEVTGPTVRGCYS